MQYTVSQKGSNFEVEVKALLEAIGYRVERDDITTGAQTDLVAYRRYDLFEKTTIVECKDTAAPTGISAVHKLFSIYAAFKVAHPTAEAMIVSRSGFTAEAKRIAKTHGIHLITLEELKENSFNSREIAKFNLGMFEEAEISLNYVPLSGQTGETTPGTIYKPIENFLDDFFIRTALDGCIILGNFGSGKTSLCLNYTMKLSEQWLNSRNPASYLPVPIRLRELSSLRHIESDILEILRTRTHFGIADRGFVQALENLRFLFIFDGLDEIAQRWDREAFFENIRGFKGLLKKAKHSKILVTCRTHFFRSIIDEDIFENFVKIYVRDWGRSELESYVNGRLAENSAHAISRIENTYNLGELAKTPIFLRMITETIGELRGNINHAQLYKVYTQKWIAEQNSRSLLSPADKSKFMEIAAFYMILTGKLTLSHDRQLKDVITRVFPSTDSSLIEKIDNDVRTCSFLIRNDEGDYFFAHKSYMEYFVGQALAQDIQSNYTGRLEKKDYGLEVSSFIACFFESDWRSIIFIIRSTDDAFVKLNCASVLYHIPANDSLVEFAASMLGSAEDVRIRRRYLDCLSRWGTESCKDLLLAEATNLEGYFQVDALILLGEHLASASIGSKILDILPYSSDEFRAVAVRMSMKYEVTVLRDCIEGMISSDILKRDEDLSAALLQYITESMDASRIATVLEALNSLARQKGVDLAVQLDRIYGRCRGVISRDCAQEFAAGRTYQETERYIRKKWAPLLDRKEIKDILTDAQRIGQRDFRRKREEKLS
ncbi:restriction endonuclease [Rhizobium sp. Leaf386]|uniref:restriction endonuclease n=1 Tax=Rhizobium sp. Leaf386 TaxID=1736359 RepID=UPI000715C3B1|nr:restriction endonuclease [Rhizobium sp. Leaf386]KQS95599.1 hypothetical protein ASG50_25200 [Rhizobium sp. Leaf386]